MRLVLEPGSPSNGRLRKLPTTANSLLSQMCGHLESCSQNLSHMVVYLIQVRIVSTALEVESSDVIYYTGLHTAVLQ